MNDKRCFLCGRNDTGDPLERHHIFGGANRKKSEKYGLVVYLCGNRCHRNGRGTQERRPDAPFETVRAAQGDGGAEMDGGGLSPRIWEKLFMRGDKTC